MRTGKNKKERSARRMGDGLESDVFIDSNSVQNSFQNSKFKTSTFCIKDQKCLLFLSLLFLSHRCAW
jgi:hypothetical protein